MHIWYDMLVTRTVARGQNMTDKNVMDEIRAIVTKGNSALVKIDKNGNFAIYEVKKKITVK